MMNTNIDILKVVKAKQRQDEINAYGKQISFRHITYKSKKSYNRKRDRKVSFEFF